MERFHFTGGRLIHNRVHIALCSAVAAWAWAQVTGLDLVCIDLIVIPLVMLCIYQWNRTFDHREDAVNTARKSSMSTAQRLLVRWLCMVGFLSAALLSLQTAANSALGILMAVIMLGIFYSTPVIGHAGLRLKNLFVVKNLTSALGWTLLVVVYPVFHAGEMFNTAHSMAAMVMFSSVWVVEILWDIRDRRGDSLAGVQTVPVLLGTNAAKRWVLTINSLSAAVLAVTMATGYLSGIWAIVLSNNLLVGYWSSRFPDASTATSATRTRYWSHQLVGFQTTLLFCLGVVSMMFT